MPARRRTMSKKRRKPYAVKPPAPESPSAENPSPQNSSAQALPDAHSPSNNHLFTVHDTPSKGRGSFATTPILPGTRLVNEPALLSFDHDPRAADIDQLLHTLPTAIRKQYQSLSSGARPHTNYAIFATNSIQMLGAARGVFLRTSRFNHSCVPNAYFGYDVRARQVRIHAIVPIAQGEEITINYGYGGAYRTREQRLRALRFYGFECACPACAPKTAAERVIELRRTQMAELHGKIERNHSNRNNRIRAQGENLEALGELLEGAAEAGDVMYTALADAYRVLAEWYLDAGMRAYCDDETKEVEEHYLRMAKMVAEKKVVLDVSATGNGSAEVRDAVKLVERADRRLAEV